MGVKKFLDFARIDVFAAADNHVFQASGDAEIAVGAHGCKVAGVQPAFGVNGAGGGVGVLIVTFHIGVAAGAELALFADRDDRALGGDDFDLGFRAGAAYGGDTEF